MEKMFLQRDTILSIYVHNSKTVLCRIIVLPSNTNGYKNGDSLNTCRSMSAAQRSAFDKELRLWFDRSGCDGHSSESNLCRFSINPNVEVKIRKSNLTINEFLKCFSVDGPCKGKLDEEKCSQVLDCLLEYKILLPMTPSPATEEYEPTPTTLVYNNESANLISYEPYTPSKRKRRFHSEYKIRAPCRDLMEFESADDTYSPTPVGLTFSTTEVANYSPAPIKERSTSLYSQNSAKDEIIGQTRDEHLPYGKYATIRPTLKSNGEKHLEFEEYVPQTQIVTSDIPAYNPTPIECGAKKDRDKMPKEKITKLIGDARTEPKDRIKTGDHDRPRDTASKDRAEKLTSESTQPTLKELKLKLSRTSASSDNERESCTRKYQQHKDKPKQESNKSKESSTDIPAYNPTPIECGTKKDRDKMPKDKITKLIGDGRTEPKDRIKTGEHDRPRDTVSNDRAGKLTSESTQPTLKEIKLKSSRTPTSSDIAREICTRKYQQHRDRQKQESNKSKENSSEIGQTSKLNEEHSDAEENKMSSKKVELLGIRDSKHYSNYLASKDVENAGSTHGNQKSHRIKDQQRRKGYVETAETGKKLISKKGTTNTDMKYISPERKNSKDGERFPLTHSTRRSERAPSKPKRLTENHEVYGMQKKSRTIKTSTKNKELFGSDDDDDDGDVFKKFPVHTTSKADERNILPTLDVL